MSKEEIQSRREETYRKILDVSWEIAVKDGLESLSVRKVAAALGFAPNNLYNYFQNKDELLFQLKKDAYRWTLPAVFNDIPNCATVRQTMDVMAHRMLHAALKEPERFVVMTSDLIMDSHEPLDRQFNAYVASAISRGIENGEFRNLDPQITATNIRTSIIGVVRWISAQKELTPEQADSYMENFLTVLFEGIGITSNTGKPK